MEQMEIVIGIVCQVYGISQEDFYGPSRAHPLPFARFTATAILVRYFGIRYAILSNHIGKNHSTITYHLKTHDNLMETDKYYQSKFKEITNKISMPTYVIHIKGDGDKQFIKSTNELTSLVSNYLKYRNTLTIEITKY